MKVLISSISIVLALAGGPQRRRRHPCLRVPERWLCTVIITTQTKVSRRHSHQVCGMLLHWFWLCITLVVIWHTAMCHVSNY